MVMIMELNAKSNAFFAQTVNAAYNFKNNFSGHVQNVTGRVTKVVEKDDDDFTVLDIETAPSNGWELLATSLDSTESAAYQYKAVAFINKTTREIVFANAGTKPEDTWDLVDDSLIAELKYGATTLKNSSVPYKISSIKAFINNVENKLLAEGENSQQYSFSTSGHSLGGILSDLCGVELISRGFNVTKSVTFENPGSKPVIETAIKNGDFSSAVNINDLKQRIAFHTYNSKPNVINSCNDPMGEVKILVTPLANNSQGDTSLQGWGSYLLNKVGSVVNAVSEQIGLNGVFASLQAVEYHYLSKQMEYYDTVGGFTVDRLDRKINQPTKIQVDDNILGKLKNIKKPSEDSSSKFKNYVIEDFTAEEIIDEYLETWVKIDGNTYYVDHSELQNLATLLGEVDE